MTNEKPREPLIIQCEADLDMGELYFTDFVSVNPEDRFEIGVTYEFVERAAYDSLKEECERLKNRHFVKEWEERSQKVIELANLLAERDAEISRLREALLDISKGCATKMKGCTCLENMAMIALAGSTSNESGGKDV